MRVAVILSGDAERVAVEISHRERNNAFLCAALLSMGSLDYARDDGKRMTGEDGRKNKVAPPLVPPREARGDFERGIFLAKQGGILREEFFLAEQGGILRE